MKMRQIFRVVVLALAMFWLVYAVPVIVRDTHNWQKALRRDDRSAAELYETDLELHAFGTIVVLGIAGAAWFMLRGKRDPGK
jgi:hypothetical protein